MPDGHAPHKETIKLNVVPFLHQSTPSVISDTADSAGIVMFGFYSIDYKLPNNSTLHILMNHNHQLAQFILTTHDTELIKALPGPRKSSIVSNTIASISHYLRRSQKYATPLTAAQLKKRLIATNCIEKLQILLKREKNIRPHDVSAQEALRRDVIRLIESARDENRIIANHILVSEGYLGDLLYDTKQNAQAFAFNPYVAVSAHDQHDFSDIALPKTLLWDSEIHVGQDEEGLHDTLSTIINHFHLTPSPSLATIEANRFDNARRFFKTLIFDGRDWFNHLANPESPEAPLPTELHKNNLNFRTSPPYYTLDGIAQKGYESLITLAKTHLNLTTPPLAVLTSEMTLPNGAWAILEKEHCIIYQENNQRLKFPYFIENKYYYPSPHGEDLYTISMLSKRHLYWPERLKLHLKAFLTSIPKWLHYIYQHVKTYITSTLVDDIFIHIHHDHLVLSTLTTRLKQLNIDLSTTDIKLFNDAWLNLINTPPVTLKKQNIRRYCFECLSQALQKTSLSPSCILTIVNHSETVSSIESQIKPLIIAYQQAKEREAFVEKSITETLQQKGLLPNGLSLENFIKETIEHNQWAVITADNPPHPIHYDNPIHRMIDIIRHISHYFIEGSEKHPIIGTAAILAYLYGGAAIIAPDKLTAVLTKLHLHGLTYGIIPTQKLAHFMSHGTTAEAISASATYWQAIMVSGQFDQWFVNCVDILKENPAEVAIIISLALSLGYGLCRVFPPLGKEMGDFPFTNYAALGAKGGIALQNTIMYPGDDWLIGTIKWVLICILTVVKIILLPFVEGYYYGFNHGFINGLYKSLSLTQDAITAILASIIDMFLTLAIIPFHELPAMLIHVPFRGFTQLLSKTLGTLGGLTRIGEFYYQFATRNSEWHYFNDLRLSPLYGFHITYKGYMFIYQIPHQLFKNVTLLPFIDLLSLTIRILLTLINITSRIAAFLIAFPFLAVGALTDATLGVLLTKTATLITNSANVVDKQVGMVKQQILSHIEIARREVYEWAFFHKTQPSSKKDPTTQYFSETLTRIEKAPHQETHCLVEALGLTLFKPPLDANTLLKNKSPNMC